MTGTLLQSGDIPVRLGPADETGKSTILENGKPRETRVFDGKTYGMETALKGDVAIVRAWKVDEEGNCQFRYVYQFAQVSLFQLMILDTPQKHSVLSWPRQQRSLL